MVLVATPATDPSIHGQDALPQFLIDEAKEKTELSFDKVVQDAKAYHSISGITDSKEKREKREKEKELDKAAKTASFAMSFPALMDFADEIEEGFKIVEKAINDITPEIEQQKEELFFQIKSTENLVCNIEEGAQLLSEAEMQIKPHEDQIKDYDLVLLNRDTKDENGNDIVGDTRIVYRDENTQKFYTLRYYAPGEPPERKSLTPEETAYVERQIDPNGDFSQNLASDMMGDPEYSEKIFAYEEAKASFDTAGQNVYDCSLDHEQLTEELNETVQQTETLQEEFLEQKEAFQANETNFEDLKARKETITDPKQKQEIEQKINTLEEQHENTQEKVEKSEQDIEDIDEQSHQNAALLKNSIDPAILKKFAQYGPKNIRQENQTYLRSSDDPRRASFPQPKQTYFQAADDDTAPAPVPDEELMAIHDNMDILTDIVAGYPQMSDAELTGVASQFDVCDIDKLKTELIKEHPELKNHFQSETEKFTQSYTTEASTTQVNLSNTNTFDFN